MPNCIEEYSWIHASVLRLIHSLLRSDFATECGLLLTPYSSSFRPSYHSFNNVFLRQFLRKMWPVHIAFLLFALSRVVLSSLTLCNPYSFFTLTEYFTNNLFRSLLSLFQIKITNKFHVRVTVHPLRKERKLRVFENMVLRRIFGPRRDEVTGEWRRLHNEELNDLYPSPNSIVANSWCWIY